MYTVTQSFNQRYSSSISFKIYRILPGVNAWNVSNLPSPTKRAFGTGYLVHMGNAGAILGGFMYQKEVPSYPTGYGNSLAFASAGFMPCLVLEFCLFRLNKQKAQLSDAEIWDRYTDENLSEMGEKSPLCNYTL